MNLHALCICSWAVQGQTETDSFKQDGTLEPQSVQHLLMSTDRCSALLEHLEFIPDLGEFIGETGVACP